jgi:DNA-binding transcriptional LysR family regulator
MTLTLFHELAVFVAVARHKSFTLAARELGVSTSAVSQTVRRLEEQLGQPLLARTTRSVSLTDAGRRLMERAEPGLQAARSAVDELSARPTHVTGALRLTVPLFAASVVLEPLLPAYLQAHPHVRVEVQLADRMVDIVKEGFDAGIRLKEALARDMVHVRLTPAFRFVIVASPAYLDRHGAPGQPEDLAHHACIGVRAPTTGLPYHWELERGRRELRIPVKGPLVADSAHFIIRMAAAGVGLAYVSELEAAPWLRTGALRAVLEEWAPTVPGLFLYYPHRARASAPLKAFIDMARRRLPAG